MDVFMKDRLVGPESHRYENHEDRGTVILIDFGEMEGEAQNVLGFFVATCCLLLCYTGWWFGCHFWHFPRNIGNLIIPIDALVFFRGVA